MYGIVKVMRRTVERPGPDKVQRKGVTSYEVRESDELRRGRL
jgi:hypothetical protein